MNVELTVLERNLTENGGICWRTFLEVRLRSNAAGPTIQLGKGTEQYKLALTCTSVAENVDAAVAVDRLEIVAAGCVGYS
jgi:hypothetical protein